MKKLVSILIITMLLFTAFVMPAGATQIVYMFGDVNMDKSLDVIDSTGILRHCAKIDELEHIPNALADFDNDDIITVVDATFIQMYTAHLVEHPRRNEYLEYYVEIDDIAMSVYANGLPVTNRSMSFAPVFDEVYNTTGDKNVLAKYIFKGITDPSYYEEYSTPAYSSNLSASKSFSEPGIYEVTVKVWKEYDNGTYSFTKQFEVLPSITFDGLRFVDYTTNKNYVKPPEGASELEYEVVLDQSDLFLDKGYGSVPRTERCLALIHTKDEYDRFFGVDNTKFDDEFFKEKSLVVTMTMGYEYYDYAPIRHIFVKDDVLYVGVSFGNNSPYDDVQLPMCPLWHSFAAVDKAAVEHITAVHRY